MSLGSWRTSTSTADRSESMRIGNSPRQPALRCGHARRDTDRGARSRRSGTQVAPSVHGPEARHRPGSGDRRRVGTGRARAAPTPAHGLRRGRRLGDRGGEPWSQRSAVRRDELRAGRRERHRLHRGGSNQRVQDSADTDVTFYVCTIAPLAGVGAIGSSNEDDIHEYCGSLVPAEGATLRLHASPMQQVVMAVTLRRPGRVRIDGVDLDYRLGWQAGTQRIGGEVRLDHPS